MVQQRNVALCIVFSIITCGIYGLYWVACMTDDLNTISGQPGTSGGMVVLFTIITCGIYGIYWMYVQGTKIDETKAMRGIPSGNTGIVYILLSVLGLGIIAEALMQTEINKLA